MRSETAGRSFYFVGERPWIDFVNTETSDGGKRVDLLRHFDDLVDWCAVAEMIRPSEATEIAGRWRGGSEARATLLRAHQLRSTLRAMLERLAKGRTTLPPRMLESLNEVLRLGSGARREIVPKKRGYEIRLRRTFSVPDQLLVPIAESAAEFLSADDLSFVKKCQNPECILFFYDTTKNHRRRWCSMAACGNRAKVAAHYRRARAHAAPQSSPVE